VSKFLIVEVFRCDGMNVSLPAAPVVLDDRKQVVQPDEMVDSVLALSGSSWVACKSPKCGHITLFDSEHLRSKNNQLEPKSARFLKWTLSYDAYLSLGWEPGNFIFTWTFLL